MSEWHKSHGAFFVLVFSGSNAVTARAGVSNTATHMEEDGEIHQGKSGEQIPEAMMATDLCLSRRAR